MADNTAAFGSPSRLSASVDGPLEGARPVLALGAPADSLLGAAAATALSDEVAKRLEERLCRAVGLLWQRFGEVSESVDLLRGEVAHASRVADAAAAGAAAASAAAHKAREAAEASQQAWQRLEASSEEEERRRATHDETVVHSFRRLEDELAAVHEEATSKAGALSQDLDRRLAESSEAEGKRQAEATARMDHGLLRLEEQIVAVQGEMASKATAAAATAAEKLDGHLSGVIEERCAELRHFFTGALEERCTELHNKLTGDLEACRKTIAGELEAATQHSNTLALQHGSAVKEDFHEHKEATHVHLAALSGELKELEGNMHVHFGLAKSAAKQVQEECSTTIATTHSELMSAQQVQAAAQQAEVAQVLETLRTASENAHAEVTASVERASAEAAATAVKATEQAGEVARDLAALRTRAAAAEAAGQAREAAGAARDAVFERELDGLRAEIVASVAAEARELQLQGQMLQHDLDTRDRERQLQDQRSDAELRALHATMELARNTAAEMGERLSKECAQLRGLTHAAEGAARQRAQRAEEALAAGLAELEKRMADGGLEALGVHELLRSQQAALEHRHAAQELLLASHEDALRVLPGIVEAQVADARAAARDDLKHSALSAFQGEVKLWRAIAAKQHGHQVEKPSV